MLVIGRTPASRSRNRIHRGDGPTVTPVISRAVKRGQRSGASMRTTALVVPSCSKSISGTTTGRS